jgi:hypothetical protein
MTSKSRSAQHFGILSDDVLCEQQWASAQGRFEKEFEETRESSPRLPSS